MPTVQARMFERATCKKGSLSCGLRRLLLTHELVSTSVTRVRRIENQMGFDSIDLAARGRSLDRPGGLSHMFRKSLIRRCGTGSWPVVFGIR